MTKLKKTFNLKEREIKLLEFISDSFVGDLRLEKTIYVIDCIDNHFGYDYIRANYGPCSEEFRQDLNYLIQCQLIIKDYGETKGQPYIRYKVNEKLFSPESNDKYQFLKKMSRNQILEFIYDNSIQKSLEIGDKFPLSEKIKSYFTL